VEGNSLTVRVRHLLRPCGLAGSRWEPAAAGLYSVALGGVFGSDMLTPDDVLATLGLPPLLAAVWTLSGRLAALVSGLALSLFAVVVAVEAPNRPTIVSVGVTGVLLAVAARTCATRLAKALPVPALHPRPVFGLGSLTRREVEVARLASEGYMASEIASTLRISERTVESHLAHVYAKLGVPSKRALIRMSATFR